MRGTVETAGGPTRNWNTEGLTGELRSTPPMKKMSTAALFGEIKASLRES